VRMQNPAVHHRTTGETGSCDTETTAASMAAISETKTTEEKLTMIPAKKNAFSNRRSVNYSKSSGHPPFCRLPIPTMRKRLFFTQSKVKPWTIERGISMYTNRALSVWIGLGCFLCILGFTSENILV